MPYGLDKQQKERTEWLRWKRFFENENYQMMFKIRDFKSSGLTLDMPTPSPDIFNGTEAADVAKLNPEVFKPRSISVPGAAARAGLYALFDVNLWKKLKSEGKNTNYETAGGLVSVSDLPGGFHDLTSSDFPEDAKALIMEHFQKQLEKN